MEKEMKQQHTPMFNANGEFKGTRFFVELNESAEGTGSITTNVIHSTNCPRTNKRHLRAYLTAVGEPTWNQKRVMKAIWGI